MQPKFGLRRRVW